MLSRAQAGLEYLMTYGWALVLVAAIISVLVFVVTSPASEVIFSSSDSAKILLKSGSVSGNAAGLVLQNATGVAIEVSSVHFFGDLSAGPEFKVNGVAPVFPIEVAAGTEMHFDGLVSQNNCGSGGSVLILYSDAFGFEKRVEVKCNGGATMPGAWYYTIWEDGQTGSVGGFWKNGDTSENYRIMGEDPWGKSTVVWEARPDAVSGGDGGWNYNLPIDNTKLYRFSVWVNRTVLGTDGRFYLGTRGYGTVNGVIRISDGIVHTNPYFYVSGSPPSPAQMPEGEWVLVAGHVFPHTHTGTSRHSDSGIYTISGYLSNTSLDYKWLPETTSSAHRTYLYYTTDTSVRQQWVYPRVDVIDGTEPSIAELLNGFDSLIP